MLKYQISKCVEKFWFWLAYKLPKPLVYFASIKLIAHATTGKFSNTEVPKLTAMEALNRWEYK